MHGAGRVNGGGSSTRARVSSIGPHNNLQSGDQLDFRVVIVRNQPVRDRRVTWQLSAFDSVETCQQFVVTLTLAGNSGTGFSQTNFTHRRLGGRHSHYRTGIQNQSGCIQVIRQAGLKQSHGFFRSRRISEEYPRGGPRAKLLPSASQ